jgi:two-component system cell cycle sensor histidine kinase/response regulator CckA
VMMNVLYVEDDPRDADLARRELARSAPDLRLDVVATFQEALARLEGGSTYDLLLSDLRLPDGDGLGLLAHVRERALPLAVVIITGRGDEETVVAALRAGADDYVVKRADYLVHLPNVLADALYRYRVQAERRARPLRVLYAEPNASDADLTRRHLARHAPHIHLEVVSTGRQALRRLPDTPTPPQEIAYDLLLLDYRLPGMDALEVLKEVRQMRGLDLPVALVSGRGKSEVALQAFKLGAADYLPKNPGYLFRLPAVLENAFHRTQLAREQAALRAGEAQYRTLFEGVPMGLYRTTPAGQILDANPALVHMLGYPDRESLLAAEATGIYVNPQNRQRWQALLEREGVVTDFEVQLCRGDGATIWVWDNARVVRDAEGRTVYYEGSLEDVTERKRVEEALAEERNLLRTLIDNMPDYIFVKDTESRFLTTNTAHLRTLGVETVEEVIGKTDSSFFPQELAEQYYAGEQAVVSSGQPLLNRVERAIDPEGVEQWLLTTKVPLRDSSGSIVGLVGISRDISERVWAEEKIRRRNQELALLNRVIAASAASQEIEPILETVCRELALAFGVPQSAAALLNTERSEAVVVAEYLAQGRTSALGEVIPVKGNPSFQHLLEHQAPLVVDDAQTDSRLAPIHDIERRRGTVSLLILPLIVEGEVVGSLGVDAIEPRPFSTEEVDLAQRVAEQMSGALARARLEETQRRLSTAVEQAAEGVVITDTQYAILYVNPAFEQITGYYQAEILGQTIRLLHSDKQDLAVYERLFQTTASGQMWQGRLVSRRKDGSLYTEETAISPVRNQAGEVVNYVATMRDVTHEVELEEQFRQAQKMEAVGRLAGGVAHDFNNLLTVIHISARLLEKKLHHQDPLWEHVQRIQDAGQRATNLTKQLLAFSRREIIEPQVLNLNQVLGELDKMLRRLIGEDIELTTRLAGDLWPVKADPTQVEQVVVNLAVNARDAMPGGGSLTLETANVVLDAAYAARHLGVEAGEYVLLAVSDTGTGMSDEVKARLFEPFFTTKEEGKGTGLGLATVFGIVKQNRGHIWVYSEAGQGTTFKVYLPRAAEGIRAPSDLPAASTAPSVRGFETLLLVEDESEVRDLVRDILAAWGYRILAARDGVEALEVAQSHEGPIHLLITDVVMPRLSGKALADRLRSSRPELRVLFTSGYTDDTIVHHGVLAEGVHFLSKPFELETLAHKVREVLGSSI